MSTSAIAAQLGVSKLRGRPVAVYRGVLTKTAGGRLEGAIASRLGLVTRAVPVDVKLSEIDAGWPPTEAPSSGSSHAAAALVALDGRCACSTALLELLRSPTGSSCAGLDEVADALEADRALDGEHAIARELAARSTSAARLAASQAERHPFGSRRRPIRGRPAPRPETHGACRAQRFGATRSSSIPASRATGRAACPDRRRRASALRSASVRARARARSVEVVAQAPCRRADRHLRSRLRRARGEHAIATRQLAGAIAGPDLGAGAAVVVFEPHDVVELRRRDLEDRRVLDRRHAVHRARRRSGTPRPARPRSRRASPSPSRPSSTFARPDWTSHDSSFSRCSCSDSEWPAFTNSSFPQ